MIDLQDYQNFASRGILPATKEREPLVAFALGLVGETGEVIDDIKKKIFHGRDVPIEHTAEELGDVMWYVANIANELGLNLETIIEQNKNKLLKRYPDMYANKDEIVKDAVYVNSLHMKVRFYKCGPHIAMREADTDKFIKFVSKEEYNHYVGQQEDLPWE